MTEISTIATVHKILHLFFTPLVNRRQLQQLIATMKTQLAICWRGPALVLTNTDILQISDPSNRTIIPNIWLQQSTMLFIWLVGVNLPLGWCWWGVCAYKQLCTLPKHHSHLTTNRMSETNKTEWWKATTPVSYNPGTSLLGGFNCWLCTICMYTSLIWTVKPQCSQMGLTTVAYLWLILSGKIRENSRQKTGCKVSLCAFTDTN